MNRNSKLTVLALACVVCVTGSAWLAPNALGQKYLGKVGGFGAPSAPKFTPSRPPQNNFNQSRNRINQSRGQASRQLSQQQRQRNPNLNRKPPNSGGKYLGNVYGNPPPPQYRQQRGGQQFQNRGTTVNQRGITDQRYSKKTGSHNTRIGPNGGRYTNISPDGRSRHTVDVNRNQVDYRYRDKDGNRINGQANKNGIGYNSRSGDGSIVTSGRADRNGLQFQQRSNRHGNIDANVNSRGAAFNHQTQHSGFGANVNRNGGGFNQRNPDGSKILGYVGKDGVMYDARDGRGYGGGFAANRNGLAASQSDATGSRSIGISRDRAEFGYSNGGVNQSGYLQGGRNAGLGYYQNGPAGGYGGHAQRVDGGVAFGAQYSQPVAPGINQTYNGQATFAGGNSSIGAGGSYNVGGRQVAGGQGTINKRGFAGNANAGVGGVATANAGLGIGGGKARASLGVNVGGKKIQASGTMDRESIKKVDPGRAVKGTGLPSAKQVFGGTPKISVGGGGGGLPSF